MAAADADAQTLRLVPWVHIGWACYGVILVPVGLWIPGIETGPRVAVVLFALFLAVSAGVAVVRRTTWLVLGEELRVRTLRKSFAVPRSAITAVSVQRRVSVRSPTTLGLRLRIGEQSFTIPFAEYWLFGAEKLARARGLAQDLDVPVHDPRGEVWAQGAGPLRWLAAGHDWLFATAIAIPVAGLLAMVAWVSLG